MNPKLIPMLEALRKELGRPIIITSGFRCKKHNGEVGGVRISQHMLGNAVDIKVKGVHPSVVAIIAKSVGFKFVKPYLTFTHIDIRGL